MQRLMEQFREDDSRITEDVYSCPEGEQSSHKPDKDDSQHRDESEHSLKFYSISSDGSLDDQPGEGNQLSISLTPNKPGPLRGDEEEKEEVRTKPVPQPRKFLTKRRPQVANTSAPLPMSSNNPSATLTTKMSAGQFTYQPHWIQDLMAIDGIGQVCANKLASKGILKVELIRRFRDECQMRDELLLELLKHVDPNYAWQHHRIAACLRALSAGQFTYQPHWIQALIAIDGIGQECANKLASKGILKVELIRRFRDEYQKRDDLLLGLLEQVDPNYTWQHHKIAASLRAMIANGDIC